jgi:hypothetical protein
VASFRIGSVEPSDSRARELVVGYISNCRMILHDGLERMWREAVVAYLKNRVTMFLDVLGEVTAPLDRKSNPRTPLETLSANHRTATFLFISLLLPVFPIYTSRLVIHSTNIRCRVSDMNRQSRNILLSTLFPNDKLQVSENY